MMQIVMVLYTGAAFVAAGAILLEIARLLGKAFKTKVSAHWSVQLLVGFGAVILFGYGCVLLFPGQAVQVRHMSIGLPLVGSVVLGLALAYLDNVMGEREPPPWSVDVMRLAALLGWDGVMSAVFRTDPALYGDALPDHGGRGRLLRLAIIIAAIAMIVLISGVILTSSATA